MGAPPEGGLPTGGSTASTAKVSTVEGDWSFDVITTTSGNTKTVTSTSFWSS